MCRWLRKASHGERYVFGIGESVFSILSPKTTDRWKGENWTSAASALWSWLAMTSARCPSPVSCAGSCWAGRLRPSRSLSQMR